VLRMRLILSVAATVAVAAIGSVGRLDAQEEPERYALLVGVTTYDHPYLNGLKYPEKDIAALARVLSDNGYRVDKLQGVQATQAEIRTRLERLSNKGARGGVVFVALSGHGIEIPDPTGRVNKSYFCPVDTELAPVQDADDKTLFQADGTPLLAPRADSLVAIDEILMALGQSKAKHRIIVTDCCRDDPTKAKSLRAKSFGTSLEAKDLPENCVMLMACSSGERSFEHDDWGHGALAKCLLDELVSGTSQTMVEVANNVPPRVTQLVKEKKGSESQVPRFLITGRVELLFPDRNLQAETAANLKGNSEFRAGLSFYFGENNQTIDEIRALRFFRRAADDGHPIAAAWVAQSYLWGWGGNHRDPAEAIRWMRRAMPRLASLAEAGNDDAAFIFGSALQYGIGVRQDIDRARSLWERCAKNGNVEAYLELGGIYESLGDNVKAFSSYLEADRKGSIRGTYAFSRALSGVIDVLVDRKQAFELMEKARGAGLSGAYHMAAHYYDVSYNDSPQAEDAEQAFRLRRKSYELGSRQDPRCFTRYYFNGYGTAADPGKGLQLLAEAAQTDPNAQEELIRRIEEGDGVAKDASKLEDWRRTHLRTYREAARLGHASSLYQLFRLAGELKYRKAAREDFTPSAVVMDLLNQNEIPSMADLLYDAIKLQATEKSEPLSRRVLRELESVIQNLQDELDDRDRERLLELLAEHLK